MKVKHMLISVVAGASLFFTSCAPAPQQTAQPQQKPAPQAQKPQAQKPEANEPALPDLPEWLMNPFVEDGLAAATCVNFSGDFETDRLEAVNAARNDLAKQIDVKVAAMEKVYREKTTEGANSKSGALFKTVARTLTEARLQGARPRKQQFISIDGKRKLCVMVTLGGKNDLFNKILQNAKVNVKPDEKEKLKKEFEMKKAEEDMDKRLAR